MIQINLSTTKRPVDITNVGGIDLSKINVKFVLLAILIYYSPGWFIYPQWEAEIETEAKKLEVLTQERTKLASEVDALKDFDKQIEALNKQEEKLKAKLEVVKGILSKRQNPWEVLVYVAQNIPTELWLTSLQYEGKRIVFKGLSMDYTPQGVFLENIKKSVFFDKNVSYSKSETTAVPQGQKNLAPFEISAQIMGSTQ